MRQVQEALKGIVPVYADTYRATDKKQTAPKQYAVYVTRTIEDEHWDDDVQTLKTFVYMNLWSADDPTEKAKEIRRAMRGAGFCMDEESTGSTSGEADYATGAKLHCVSWTWVYREAV